MTGKPLSYSPPDRIYLRQVEERLFDNLEIEKPPSGVPDGQAGETVGLIGRSHSPHHRRRAEAGYPRL